MNAYQKLVDILSSLYQENCMTENEVTLYKDYPLSRLTSFRTGGNATVLFPETVHALTTVLPCMKREGIAYFILGCGSNVIAKDEGYDGIIVNVSHLKEASISGNNITAQCGVSVTALAALAQKNALSGMEFFYGIPGSVGGAVFMNAGAYDGECKNILRSVTFLSREGKVQTLPAAHLEMGYRHSIFQQNGAVILSAEFQLEPGDPAAIRSRMEELMAKRVEKQPLEYPSAGSTFKRCEGRFTAKMIEDAGLKGMRVGGAQVSTKHAGFIINAGNATSRDILDLIQKVKDVILEKEQLCIACEVRVIE